MRSNPLRRDLSIYPHQLEMQTRFSDVDPQWHLNNARLAEYYQEARVSFFRRLAVDHQYHRPKGTRTLVAHQSIDYLGEVDYPGNVILGVGLAHVGNSSYTIALAMFAKGACVGLSKAVLVYSEGNGPAALPAEFRRVLEQYLLPEAAREG
jgi:acyl-CoA thioester hydrolase